MDDSSSSQQEKFLRLCSHIAEQKRVVADCFDDWRRSNTLSKLLVLQNYHLPTDEHLSHLSAGTRWRISPAET